MDIDQDRIDQTVLALLVLTLHDENRAWKTFDWDVLKRLHEKGLISNPVNASNSVVLTAEGLASAQRMFRELFVEKK
jgi:hypothetical protein